MLTFACLRYYDAVLGTLSVETQADVLVIHERENACRGRPFRVHSAQPLALLCLLYGRFDILADMSHVLLFCECCLDLQLDKFEKWRLDAWFLINNVDISWVDQEWKSEV